jgi:hypothetical protein
MTILPPLCLNITLPGPSGFQNSFMAASTSFCLRAVPSGLVNYSRYTLAAIEPWASISDSLEMFSVSCQV